MLNAFNYLDYMRYDNIETEFIAHSFCQGNHRIFVEWMPNGDYFFKIRPTYEGEYGIDKPSFFRMVSFAEKQALYNDRRKFAKSMDLRNYYSY